MNDMLLLINLDIPASRAVARKLRGEGYFCLIADCGRSLSEEITADTRGIVLCGGSEGVAAEIPGVDEILAAGLPVLAFGDAALGLCEHFGGTTVSLGQRERPVTLSSDRQERLLRDIAGAERFIPQPAAMNLPAGCRPVCWSPEGAVMGFARNDRAVYGFAFQVESNDPEGVHLLRNFARDICGCDAWWNDDAFIERAIGEIVETAEDGEGICAISGGVDSALCAALGARALGERMHCLFIDTGLLREGEADQIMNSLSRIAGLRVQRIDAQAEFLEALQGVTGAKEKEQIIYARLRAHIRHEVSGRPEVRVILQGTNYSDTFSGGISLRTELTGARVRLLEPVRYLFKDEIRRVAQMLRLPEEVCKRQPFPSSGLALRITPVVTEAHLRELGTADRIVREEIEAAGLNKRLWQYYASLYEYPGDNGGTVIVLRAVQAMDRGAVAARLPSDMVERMTERILRDVPNVSRVLYDMTPSKTYRRIEWG